MPGTGFSAWLNDLLPTVQAVFTWLKDFILRFFSDVIGKNYLLYLVLFLTALGAAAVLIGHFLLNLDIGAGNYVSTYKLWHNKKGLRMGEYSNNWGKLFSRRSVIGMFRSGKHKNSTIGKGKSHTGAQAGSKHVNSSTRQTQDMSTPEGREAAAKAHYGISGPVKIPKAKPTKADQALDISVDD